MGMSTGGGSEDGMMSEINVTPFVDVMLVLLIIFMVTTPMMTMGMNVNLPRAAAPSMDVPDELVVIGVTADGQYFINEHAYPLEELLPKVKNMVEMKPDQQVFLKADGAERESRLALCDLTGRVLRRGLDLLGIGTVEKM